MFKNNEIYITKIDLIDILGQQYAKPIDMITKCQHIDYPNHKTICRSSVMEIKITTPHSQFPDYAY